MTTSALKGSVTIISDVESSTRVRISPNSFYVQKLHGAMVVGFFFEANPEQEWVSPGISSQGTPRIKLIHLCRLRTPMLLLNNKKDDFFLLIVLVGESGDITGTHVAR